ncbi:MAG: nuclear transport factor 2 family protein [Gammaproteobacteria bacterium]
MNDETNARLRITETLNRYAWGYDTRDLEMIGDTFTEDGVFVIELDGSEGWGPYEGRNRIVEWLSEVMKSQTDQRRHCVTNLIFCELSENAAQVNSYLVLTAVESGQLRTVCTGTYHDTMVREGNDWRIQQKLLKLDNPF